MTFCNSIGSKARSLILWIDSSAKRGLSSLSSAGSASLRRSGRGLLPATLNR